jgi:phosphoglycolate phosphatase-like HAD superfamily hydrolase
MLGGIKHFIWDFDGTLFDTYPFTVDCFSRALSDLGHTVDKAEIFDHMMDTIHHTFDYYAEKFSLGGRLLEKYREYAATESYRTSPPFSRAAELLKTVKETGGCNYMFTHRRADVFPFLDGTGMREAFLEIVTMENGFKAKPDPEAIQYLVDKI